LSSVDSFARLHFLFLNNLLQESKLDMVIAVNEESFEM